MGGGGVCNCDMRPKRGENARTHTHTAREGGLGAPVIFNNLIDSVKGCQWRHL